MRSYSYYFLTLILGLFLLTASEGCSPSRQRSQMGSAQNLPRGHGGKLRGRGKHNPHKAARRMRRSHRR
jgi:hypothetical protein